jgi:hypothetical protein
MKTRTAYGSAGFLFLAAHILTPRGLLDCPKEGIFILPGCVAAFQWQQKAGTRPA